LSPKEHLSVARQALRSRGGVEFTDRKRNQMWRSPEVLDALERFAARAGRRTGAAR